MKIALAIIALLGALFAAVTYAALNLGGVAIVETQKEDGTLRSTRVWHVKRGQNLWIEAGSDTNGWFVDVERTGELTLTADGNPFRYQVEIRRSPEARQPLRAMLREKYGWRDLWVGLFIDQANTVPVLLSPVAGGRIPQGERVF